ncbi:hypothetical protein DUI87_13125 [Hirundo rustica rustica]|uniref:Major facilitator superfamily (MFS) profile domain-containing protein n=1 Tax=Hirundo rustica rustica TaxID=333673 RepID=A0A3M0KAU3_HIRRU|nr:hypothetical protein DUI87_13125 [Hirundo rustica rustica]
MIMAAFSLKDCSGFYKERVRFIHYFYKNYKFCPRRLKSLGRNFVGVDFGGLEQHLVKDGDTQRSDGTIGKHLFSLGAKSLPWYYSATILQMSGVEDDRLAIWLAALTAFINFIFTLVGVWLVERMGRRKLTLGSLTEIVNLKGTAVALIILASGFLLSAQVSPRITLNPPDPSHQNSTCTKYRTLAVWIHQLPMSLGESSLMSGPGLTSDAQLS